MQKLHIAAIVAPLAFAFSGSADVIDYNTSVPFEDTNWLKNISVPKFDPALGTLTKVSWTFGGTIKGDMRFESLDSAPTTVNMQIQSEFKLMLPDLTALITVNPQLDRTDNVTEYDTVTDFDGTSGRSYFGLSDTKSDSGFATDQATLDSVTGLGDFALKASALGSTSNSGAGNLLAIFTSQGSADLKVTYEYTPVPTPGAMGLLGLAGLVAGRRRR